MNAEDYKLSVISTSQQIKLSVRANDAAHAQAQASDICRALDATQYELTYSEHKFCKLSELFNKLALSEFKATECFNWDHRADKNGYPCLYLFKRRVYVRPMILKYLDIPTENCNLKLICNNKNCINPYHFSYTEKKNEKLTGGDTQLLLAYASQGASVKQIAKAFNVHRSTIYRKLERERLHSGVEDHCRSRRRRRNY